MDEVNCTGAELTLDSCPRNQWKQNDCTHHEDVGVICQRPGKAVVSCIASKPSYCVLELLKGWLGGVTPHPKHCVYSLNVMFLLCLILSKTLCV